jgi:uncharacterized protein
MSDSVIDNAAANRFELKVGDHMAFAEYEKDGSTLSLTYVFAPEPLRGSGAAGRLMEGLSAMAGIKGQKIIPVCPYAVAWYKRHPQFHNLLR